ncbi:MAG: hypothetical protein Fur0034_06330 [Desulfuromonadia bacterium]
MSRRYSRFVPFLIVFCAGCTLATVDVGIISERTSLENQVLGSYNRLSEDLLLVASVRGVTPTGTIATPAPRSPESRDATAAMETIAFHADDIETFKRLGWVGENLEGLLTTFPRVVPADLPPELKRFVTLYSDDEFRQVVEETNQARETVMKRVIQTSDRFTSADLPAIRRVFARMNREKSPRGTRVQTEDGRWTTL